jgi:hypothetical protein
MANKPDTRDEFKQNDAESRCPSNGGSDKGDSGIPTDLAKRLKEYSFTGNFIKAEEAELCRPVKVRMGNKTKETPLIREVIRQLGDAALKGDRSAQLALLAQYHGDQKWLLQGKNQWLDLSVLTAEELKEYGRLIGKAWVGPKPKATPEELKAQKKKEAKARKQHEADVERHRRLEEHFQRLRDRGSVS